MRTRPSGSLALSQNLTANCTRGHAVTQSLHAANRQGATLWLVLAPHRRRTGARPEVSTSPTILKGHHHMSDTPPPRPAPQPAAPLTEAEDRQWASFAHLGGILSFLPSLIIWLVFKDRGAFTNVEAKEALNFQITRRDRSRRRSDHHQRDPDRSSRSASGACIALDLPARALGAQRSSSRSSASSRPRTARTTATRSRIRLIK